VLLLGVIREFRGKGIDGTLYDWGLASLRQTWHAERRRRLDSRDNAPMTRRPPSSASASPKTYRVYDKLL